MGGGSDIDQRESFYTSLLTAASVSPAQTEGLIVIKALAPRKRLRSRQACSRRNPRPLPPPSQCFNLPRSSSTVVCAASKENHGPPFSPSNLLYTCTTPSPAPISRRHEPGIAAEIQAHPQKIETTYLLGPL